MTLFEHIRSKRSHLYVGTIWGDGRGRWTSAQLLKSLRDIGYTDEPLVSAGKPGFSVISGQLYYRGSLVNEIVLK